MSRPTIIEVPYHLGQRDDLLAKGVPVLSTALAARDTPVRTVEADGEAPNEIAGSLAVVRSLAEVVRDVDFPVVLAGNCNSCLGTVPGIGGEGGGVWFDAHDDFNTSDTTQTGFFDGMGLAILTGTGWTAMRQGLATVPEELVVHVGARDVSAAEHDRLEQSAIRVVRRPPLDEALDDLRTRVDAVYVHVDLDVLDPSVGRANRYAAPDGLLVDELTGAIDAIAARFEIRAAAFTAYEPDEDPGGGVPRAARAAYDRLLAAKAVAA